MIVSTGTRPVTSEATLRISSRRGAKAAIAALFVSTCFVTTPVSATEYMFGDAKLSIDTTVSVGATMRTSGRDCQRISVHNGGCTYGNKATGVNSDNGNLNFDRWDFTNAIVKATTDIQLSWENFGAFVRPRAFYDYIYDKNDMDFRKLSPSGRREMAY